MAESFSQADQDNRADQLNPTHSTYYRSRGLSVDDAAAAAAEVAAKQVAQNKVKPLKARSV